MSRWPGLTWAIGLLLAGACAGPDSCGSQPLSEPIASQHLGERALEFHVPAMEIEDLRHELLWLLGGSGEALVALDLSAQEGSLGGSLGFDSEAFDAQVFLDGLDSALGQGSLNLELRSKATSLALPIQVYSDQEPLRRCTLSLHLGSRSGWVDLQVLPGDDDQGLVFMAESGWDAGDYLDIELEEGCPEQEGSQLEAIWRPALDESMRRGLDELGGRLAQAAGSSLGLDSGGSGRLPQALRFQVTTQAESLDLQQTAWTLALEAGVTAGSNACVPPDLSAAPPAAGIAFDFPDVLPRSGAGYSMAVSVSRAFLQQGLTAAHRSGMFCRRAGDGSLQLEVADLLRSLGAYSTPGPVRIGLCPDAAPELSYLGADLDSGEKLFRIRLSLGEVQMDIYAEMDGSDLRVLGCRSNLILTLIPRIEQGQLLLDLADLSVNQLEILHSDMLSESGEELRAAASEVVRRAAHSLVGGLPALPLSLPVCGAGEVLEGQIAAEHLVVYFADPFEPGPWPRP